MFVGPWRAGNSPCAFISTVCFPAGLELKTPEYFWSHVAEYPSHHAELPPNAEKEFEKALTNGGSFGPYVCSWSAIDMRL